MNEIEISGRVLLELVTGANVATAHPRENRQHLTGVHVRAGSGELRAGGTNGVKLAIGTYDMPTVSANFELLLAPNGVKSLTAWLKNLVKECGNKGLNPIPVTLNNSSVNYCGDVVDLELLATSWPIIDGIVPPEFHQTLSPAQGFSADILADIAKIPNTNRERQINLRIAYDMRPSMASWVNDSGVAWRYVMMPRPTDRILDIA
jgi:hypothetical protein